MEEFIKVVQTLGFPAFVAGFLLLRYEKRLEKMNSYLIQIITILKAKVEEEDKND